MSEKRSGQVAQGFTQSCLESCQESRVHNLPGHPEVSRDFPRKAGSTDNGPLHVIFLSGLAYINPIRKLSIFKTQGFKG